jgi:hypothetical protein
MKWKTYWWGCKFLAENDDEEEFLKKFKHILGEKTSDCYEEGTAELIESDTEIMLEINR